MNPFYAIDDPEHPAPRDGRWIELKCPHVIGQFQFVAGQFRDSSGFIFKDCGQVVWREILPDKPTPAEEQAWTCPDCNMIGHSHGEPCFARPAVPSPTYHGHAVHAKLNTERQEHVAALVPSPGGTPRKWQEAYERELEHSDRVLKQCEAEDDKYGKCFHEGRQSGLINIDIMAGQIFDALETELSAALEERKQWVKNAEESSVQLSAALARAEQAEKETATLRVAFAEASHNAGPAFVAHEQLRETALQLAEAKARMEELEKSEALAIEFCVGLSLADPNDYPNKLWEARKKNAALKTELEEAKAINKTLGDSIERIASRFQFTGTAEQIADQICKLMPL